MRPRHPQAKRKGWIIRGIRRIKSLILSIKNKVFLEFNGAAEGTRTPDPIITNDVLYQLSYSGTVALSLAPVIHAGQPQFYAFKAKNTAENMMDERLTGFAQPWPRQWPVLYSSGVRRVSDQRACHRLHQ